MKYIRTATVGASRKETEKEKCRAVRVLSGPSRGIERSSSQAVTSPLRLNRRGVTVPYRVLPGSEVAGLLGSPPPVRPWRSQKRPALPVFLHPPAPKDATPWTILSWVSALLHGMSRSLRPRPLGRGHLSWGSFAPTALGVERVHVPTGYPARLPGSYPRGSPTGPTPPATVPLTGFPNLSAAFFLSPPSYHFQAGGARGVTPFRGLFLLCSPGDSSPPACPHDVPPAGCANPRPRRGHPRAHRLLPRMSQPMPLIVFRAFVRKEIDLRQRYGLEFR